MNNFTETDCAIQLNGHSFTANGAMVDDDRLICYAREPEDRPEGNGWTPLSGWTFTDWQGNTIGKGRCDSHWRVGPYRLKMYQFTIRLDDGRIYKGRGQGSGCYVSAKRSHKP